VLGSDVYPDLSSGGHLSLDLRIGNAGMGWGFDVFSGTAYQVSGVVSDMSGNPVGGIEVSMWAQEFGSGGVSDESGHYSIYVPAGTYNMGVKPSEAGNFFEPGVTVDSDLSKDIRLMPSMVISQLGQDPWLGFYYSGGTLTANFVISTPSGQPVTGFDTSLLNIWVHNPADPTLTDNDPSNDWWSNPVENQYHARITDDVTYTEVGNGVYGLSYLIDDSNPVFSSSGHFDLEIRGGDAKVYLPFDLIAHATTISGHVVGPSGALVGATVIIDFGQSQPIVTMTDNQGNYQLQSPLGLHKLAVLPPQGVSLPGHIEDVQVQDVPLTVDVTLVTLPGPIYSVSGTVTNNLGGPVLEAKVTLVQGQYILGGKTNGVGVYTTGCLSGPGTLMVSPPQGSGLMGSQMQVDLVSGPNIVDIVLSPP
jgi:hypothetical protein